MPILPTSGYEQSIDSLTTDLALLLRKGWIADGRWGSGHLTWSDNDGWSASISHQYDMLNPENATFTLEYRSRRGSGEWISHKQTVRLVDTLPPFGGWRWWVLCPVLKHRAGKLYLPDGGDIFASCKAWGLAYRSQRSASRDRAFGRLFAIQRRLGCPEGWEKPIWRPKGMWRRNLKRWSGATGSWMRSARAR